MKINGPTMMNPPNTAHNQKSPAVTPDFMPRRFCSRPIRPTDLVHPDVHGNSNSQRRDHQGDEPEIHRTSAVPPRCDDIEVLAGPGQHPDVVDAEGDYPQQNVLEQGPVGVKSAHLKRRSARLRDTARVTWLLALGQRLTIGLPILVRIRLGRERNLAALRRNIGFRIE